MGLVGEKMSGKNDILPRMVKDYYKIEELLDELEEELKKGYPNMKRSFSRFEWELEKHIFVEERAVFTEYSPKDITEGYKMLPVVTKHHNFILNKLNNWREDVQNRRNITDISELKDFLIKHREYEETELYPKLDQALDEEQKKHIIDRIEQIVEY